MVHVRHPYVPHTQPVRPTHVARTADDTFPGSGISHPDASFPPPNKGCARKVLIPVKAMSANRGLKGRVFKMQMFSVQNCNGNVRKPRPDG